MTNWAKLASELEQSLATAKQTEIADAAYIDKVEQRLKTAFGQVRDQVDQIVAEYNKHVTRDEIRIHIKGRRDLDPFVVRIGGANQSFNREVSFGLANRNKIHVSRTDGNDKTLETMTYHISSEGTVQFTEGIARKVSIQETADEQCKWLLSSGTKR